MGRELRAEIAALRQANGQLNREIWSRDPDDSQSVSETVRNGTNGSGPVDPDDHDVQEHRSIEVELQQNRPSQTSPPETMKKASEPRDQSMHGQSSFVEPASERDEMGATTIRPKPVHRWPKVESMPKPQVVSAVRTDRAAENAARFKAPAKKAAPARQLPSQPAVEAARQPKVISAVEVDHTEEIPSPISAPEQGAVPTRSPFGSEVRPPQERRQPPISASVDPDAIDMRLNEALRGVTEATEWMSTVVSEENFDQHEELGQQLERLADEVKRLRLELGVARIDGAAVFQGGSEDFRASIRTLGSRNRTSMRATHPDTDETFWSKRGRPWHYILLASGAGILGIALIAALLLLV